MSIRKIWDEITRRRWEGEELFFFFFGKLVHVLPRSLLLLLFVAPGLGEGGRNEVESDRNNGSAASWWWWKRGGRVGGGTHTQTCQIICLKKISLPTKTYKRSRRLDRERNHNFFGSRTTRFLLK